MIKKNDKVRFAGNKDLSALQETLVVYTSEQHHQSIIKHPDGHLGSEFSQMGLPADERFAFVKNIDLKVINKDDATIIAESVADVAKSTIDSEAENVVAKKMNVLMGEQAKLSDILIVLKSTRPSDEHDLIDKMINSATKHEVKNEQKANVAAQRDVEKSIAEHNAKAEKELLNSDAATNEELDKATQERLEKEAKQRQDINSMISTAIELKIITVTENQIIRNSDERVLFNMGREELANFLQNTPDEFIEFANLINSSIKKDANPEITGDKPNDIADWEKKNDDANAKERARRDAEKSNSAVKNEDLQPKEEPVKNTDEASSEKEKTSESGADAIDLLAEYKQRILDIDGVGLKTVERIIEVCPTPQSLIEAVKGKNLPFTDKVNTELKKLVRTKFFKQFS